MGGERPVEVAEQVAHGCAEFVTAEAIILDYLKSGKADAKGYAEAHKECKRQIAELEKRVRRK